jgi:hypothetical protein
MLYLNPNKEKVLTFEVELSGASASEITGRVRFEVGGVEIGFPAEVREGEIRSVITPLKNFLKNPLRNGEVFEAQLDLYTEDQEYFSPWRGEIEVKMPVRIEAKLSEDDGRGSSKFGAKVKTVKESGLKPRPSKPRGGRQPINEYRRRTPQKRQVTKEMMENMSQEQVFKIMEKLGTTNPRIKEILYEQAAAKSKSGKPADVLKEVIKIMGRKKVLMKRRQS